MATPCTEEAIVACDLEVLNETSPWFTFTGGAGQSDIDVTLGNRALAQAYMSTWEVLPDRCTSDHNVIRIGLTTAWHENPTPAPGKR